MRRLRLTGRLIPNWERGGYDVQGPLSVEEEFSRALHRHVRVASIAGLQRSGTPVRLTLYDATLVCARADAWTMTGFECLDLINGANECHLQSWLLLPVTESMLREDEWAREQDVLARQFSEAITNFVGPPAPLKTTPRRRRR